MASDELQTRMVAIDSPPLRMAAAGGGFRDQEVDLPCLPFLADLPDELPPLQQEGLPAVRAHLPPKVPSRRCPRRDASNFLLDNINTNDGDAEPPCPRPAILSGIASPTLAFTPPSVDDMPKFFLPMRQRHLEAAHVRDDAQLGILSMLTKQGRADRWWSVPVTSEQESSATIPFPDRLRMRTPELPFLPLLP